MADPTATPMLTLPPDGLSELFARLVQQGWRLVGPTVSNGAIIYDEIQSPDDLPTGWTDRQAPGQYTLEKRDDQRSFGYVVGPQSWKKELFLPHEVVQTSSLNNGTFHWHEANPKPTPTAFIGVRACDLAAIGIQDRVFLEGTYVDPHYQARRDATLIIAVNCTEAGALCFCDSMGTGPQARQGYDLCLTEFDDYFLLESGSDRGKAIATQLLATTANPEQQAALTTAIDNCRQQMGRTLNTDGLPELLFGNLEHPQWDVVGDACLACGNCTMVCPTCFCHSIDETPDLASGPAVRERSWDSCFSEEHSHIHGWSFQPTVKDRYRQWATHKLSSWHSQFGTSGCVGCGRCIAWCPVGIDITEQVTAIQHSPADPAPLPDFKPITWHARKDPLQAASARIEHITQETHDVVTLKLQMLDNYRDQPGQFNMLALPGIGEVPISVSGDDGGAIEHTVRNVGKVTAAITALSVGDTLGVRGPYGSTWPLDQMAGRPVTLIAGGIGLAPMRGVIRHLVSQTRDPATEWVSVIYGARDQNALLFNNERKQWPTNPAVKVAVTLDRASAGWRGNVGTVTTLLQRKHQPIHGIYLMCGPEVMMAAVIRQLSLDGVPPENIYLSMERNMKCATGHCGRCQYGPHFICKDGPVFSYAQVRPLFGTPGF